MSYRILVIKSSIVLTSPSFNNSLYAKPAVHRVIRPEMSLKCSGTLQTSDDPNSSEDMQKNHLVFRNNSIYPSFSLTVEHKVDRTSQSVMKEGSCQEQLTFKLL